MDDASIVPLAHSSRSHPSEDPSRIYYLGTSRGGNEGLLFLAIDPNVRLGVFNVPGGSSSEWRLSAFRDGLGLQSRVPSLINWPGIVSIEGISVPAPYFNENMPLRNGIPLSVTLQDGTTQVLRSPLINTVAGAMEIQQVLENGEWVGQAGDPIAYAPHIRRRPLDGVPAKKVIVQFANGDRANPNPTTTAILRAGDLADRATFVRTNLWFSVNPTPFPDNANLYPHAFLQIFPADQDPALTAIALKAEHQIATFFAWDGTQVIDPDDAPPGLTLPIFEVPIVPPLPEAPNYFP